MMPDYHAGFLSFCNWKILKKKKSLKSGVGGGGERVDTEG